MCNTAVVLYALVARQLVRAVRKHRSQLAFSRRLGYRSNTVAEWEGGRRFPTGAEALRACERAGVDVAAAVARFHPGSAQALSPLDDEGVARWLVALKGHQSIGEVATRCGVSRYQASRWLAGRTRPRLPELLQLVDALTGRLPDFVGALVPIEEVPALSDEHRRLAAARRLAFDAPWTEALLRLLETEGYRALPTHDDAYVAGILELDPSIVADGLDRLVAADLVRRDDEGRLVTRGELTVDMRDRAEALFRLKSHWVGVGAERMRAPREDDWFAYNVFSVSRADLERIRQLHAAYFREVRAIVAASSPTEVVGLMNLHLMDWDPDGRR